MYDIRNRSQPYMYCRKLIQFRGHQSRIWSFVDERQKQADIWEEIIPAPVQKQNKTEELI